jgi:hypothetical protein
MVAPSEVTNLPHISSPKWKLNFVLMVHENGRLKNVLKRWRSLFAKLNRPSLHKKRPKIQRTWLMAAKTPLKG